MKFSLLRTKIFSPHWKNLDVGEHQTFHSLYRKNKISVHALLTIAAKDAEKIVSSPGSAVMDSMRRVLLSVAVSKITTYFYQVMCG